MAIGKWAFTVYIDRPIGYSVTLFYMLLCRIACTQCIDAAYVVFILAIFTADDAARN